METKNYRGKARFTYSDEGELVHISCYEGEFDIADDLSKFAGCKLGRRTNIVRRMGDYNFGFNRDGTLVEVWKAI